MVKMAHRSASGHTKELESSSGLRKFYSLNRKSFRWLKKYKSAANQITLRMAKGALFDRLKRRFNMLKLIGFHLSRAFTRTLISLILLPVAISEAVLGLWVYENHGDMTLGLLFSAIFGLGALLAVYLFHILNREVDGWVFNRLA
jgi:hypothetical protein